MTCFFLPDWGVVLAQLEVVELCPLFKTKGPGFKYQPREIQPTLYFVLGPPDVIPLPVDLCE